MLNYFKRYVRLIFFFNINTKNEKDEVPQYSIVSVEQVSSFENFLKTFTFHINEMFKKLYN